MVNVRSLVGTKWTTRIVPKIYRAILVLIIVVCDKLLLLV